MAVSGNQNPVIRLGLSPNGATIIEFPAADTLLQLHSRQQRSGDRRRVADKGNRSLSGRAGGQRIRLPGDDGQRQARAPVTSIIAQMQSGLVLTFLFYPVQQLAEQAHRVVVTYDRER